MNRLRGRFGSIIRQLLATACISIGCIGIGYDEGWASPAIPSLKEEANITLTETDLDWITSGAPIGAAIGSLFAFIFTNKVGRRGAVLVVSPFYILSYLLIALGANFACIMSGRIIAGMVNACTLTASQIYASEISSADLRGSLSGIPSIFIVLGILFAYVFGSFLDWRTMTFVELSFPLLYLFMWLQHESPVWLLQNGKVEVAEKALQSLRGGVGIDVISEEFNRIRENCDKEKEKPKFHLREVTRPLFYRPILLSIFMMFFQMFGGYGPIVFNSVSILQASNSPLHENVAAIVLAVIMLVVSIASSFFIDRFGRKILLVVSGVLMIVSLCGLGTFFYIKETQGDGASQPITWLPFAALILYYASFSVGFLTVPFILLGETFPVRYRDILSSAGFFVNMTFVFAAVRSFPGLKSDIGEYGAYWFYASVLAAGLVFVIVLLPETKGKTLEEIEAMFGKEEAETPRAAENLEMANRTV